MVAQATPVRREIRHWKRLGSPAEEADIGLVRSTDPGRRRLSDLLETADATHQPHIVRRNTT